MIQILHSSSLILQLPECGFSFSGRMCSIVPRFLLPNLHPRYQMMMSDNFLICFIPSSKKIFCHEEEE